MGSLNHKQPIMNNFAKHMTSFNSHIRYIECEVVEFMKVVIRLTLSSIETIIFNVLMVLHNILQYDHNVYLPTPINKIKRSKL